MDVTVSKALSTLRTKTSLSQEALARLLGVSFVSVNRWERGVALPGPAQTKRIFDLYKAPEMLLKNSNQGAARTDVFASRGARQKPAPLFDRPLPNLPLAPEPFAPVLARTTSGSEVFRSTRSLQEILAAHPVPAKVASTPPSGGMSAGKNTYAYDAHTYHTKVPPQGVAEILRHYLPEGGLVLDPFCGSGMTGVAASVTGCDCIMSDLSPAACFIAGRFVTPFDPRFFEAAVRTVLDELRGLRRDLYTTRCRECSRETEVLYTVWSYHVVCPHCKIEFPLWDHCRSYGERVRDHKILKEFPCPGCSKHLKKSRLTRTIAEPVQIAYMCCGSRQQEVTHPLDRGDLELLLSLEVAPPLAEGFFPTTPLPDGVNLCQPKRHGLDRIDRFYTPRNLSAMSHLWRTIHRIEDAEAAAMLAFVFTSLYQRVTRLSEFRFWGGSGNTPRFNVPFIFNETNVFRTFTRKARTIQDHLETTARHFQGEVLVCCGSATNLADVPDGSVDLVFTDPPFGGNINYSEMNLLWESWLGSYTDPKEEAIINRAQGKGLADYRELMIASFRECCRVLRDEGWFILMFMNSSAAVWEALRVAIAATGFEVRQIDIFDKEHGTFKHYVSENTAGCDLVLHCRKQGRQPARSRPRRARCSSGESVRKFLSEVDLSKYRMEFLHVRRDAETDARRLYSEWLSRRLVEGGDSLDLQQFRAMLEEWLRAQVDGG